jgi:hypothetical protein
VLIFSISTGCVCASLVRIARRRRRRRWSTLCLARRTFSERKLESESFLSLSAATWCCHYHREQLTSVYEEHFGWHALKKNLCLISIFMGVQQTHQSGCLGHCRRRSTSTRLGTATTSFCSHQFLQLFGGSGSAGAHIRHDPFRIN